MSSSNCCFLTYIQISQEPGQVVWYSHLLKNFPQFVVIHTAKVFGIVYKAEVDVFLELSCFFYDPTDVGNSCCLVNSCLRWSSNATPSRNSSVTFILVLLIGWVHLLSNSPPAVIMPPCLMPSLYTESPNAQSVFICLSLEPGYFQYTPGTQRGTNPEWDWSFIYWQTQPGEYRSFSPI